MQSVAFRAGDWIVREGDEGDTAFFIINGSVDVVVGQGAKSKIVGTLRTGEVFGEMCLIEPGPRSATVVATADTECLAASYDEFVAAIDEDPARAVEFMKTLVRRLRQMNGLMARMGPSRRGIREMFRDWQTPTGRHELDPEVVTLSWTMLW
jgi:CRP/FNR family transcriptional regulator, cyclic AMP receptor protein